MWFNGKIPPPHCKSTILLYFKCYIWILQFNLASCKLNMPYLFLFLFESSNIIPCTFGYYSVTLSGLVKRNTHKQLTKWPLLPHSSFSPSERLLCTAGWNGLGSGWEIWWWTSQTDVSEKNANAWISWLNSVERSSNQRWLVEVSQKKYIAVNCRICSWGQSDKMLHVFGAQTLVDM